MTRSLHIDDSRFGDAEEIQEQVRRIAEANPGGLVWAPAGPIIYVITAEQLNDPEYHPWAVERGSREFGEQLRSRGLID
jgi:hypothetical protein